MQVESLRDEVFLRSHAIVWDLDMVYGPWDHGSCAKRSIVPKLTTKGVPSIPTSTVSSHPGMSKLRVIGVIIVIIIIIAFNHCHNDDNLFEPERPHRLFTAGNPQHGGHLCQSVLAIRDPG